MRFGPTSLKASSVLAKGLRRPKFRTDLRTSEQVMAGEKTYVIKIEETSSYNRYGASEYELLTLCDGTRTRAEVAATWNERHPDELFAEADIGEFLDGIEPAAWEQSAGEKNLAVLERVRDERKSRVDQSNVLYISFKAWDPNKTLARIDPYLGWMFTRGFVLFSLALFIAAVYLLAGDWAQVQRDTASLYSFQNKTAYDIWAFWLLLLGLGAVHEFGHGLTCKHFGGDVHQMGFLLIYFTPAFYTDTTDIMLFDRTGRRQWVLFAGIWIELVVCAIAAFFWRFSTPGSLGNDLAYKLMLLSGIQGAVLNLNPLIKADGYYALSQFLDIDNLREDSFEFLRAWTRKYLLFRDVELPQATKRQRRIFFLFGVAAVIYSTSLLILVLVFVKNILVNQLGDWGYLATFGVIYFFARKGIREAIPVVRGWFRQKKEDYMAWKVTRWQQAGAAGLALLLLVPPMTTRVSTALVMEPGKSAPIRAQVSGQVQAVYVRTGEQVKAGQVLAVLRNPELESESRGLRDEMSLANSELRNGQERSDYDKAATGVRERSRLSQELAVTERNVDLLQVRAPIDGVIVADDLDQKAGSFMQAGDSLGKVVDRSNMKARILVRDWELEDVKDGAAVKVKVAPFPFRTYSGSVEKIMPAAALDHPVAQTEELQRLGQKLTNYFAVEMEFPNADGSLREGMTGTARITGKSSPLAWQFFRGAWRWAKSQIW